MTKKFTIRDLTEERRWTEEMIEKHLKPIGGTSDDEELYDIEQVIKFEKKIGIGNFRFISQSGVLRREKWTKSLLRDFLGEPDKTAPNPRYKSASRMKLYSITRVSEVELTEVFREKSRVAVKRSRRQKSVAKRKKEEYLNSLKKVEIEVPKLTPSKLKKESIDHYNLLWASRGIPKFASKRSSKDFLQRINVNYLRHCVSNYEELLYETYRKIGADDARHLIKLKVLRAIAKTYPKLKEECHRQIEDAKEEYHLMEQMQMLRYG